MNNLIICEYCGKEYSKYGIKNHISFSHETGSKKRVQWNKGLSAWNKGLTKENNSSLKKQSETIKQRIQSGEIIPPFKDKKHKPETIRKLKRNSGGKRRGSGRGKSGWYNDFWCDSTYELAFIIYCLDHNIDIKRNKQGFEYECECEIHKYYPDFIVNDEYVEIKGYLNKKDKYKFTANLDKPLKVILGKENNIYIKYVKEKYETNNLVMLYTTSKHKQLKKKKQFEKNKQQETKKKAKELDKYNKNMLLVDKLLNSNIDFTKYGWVSKAAEILNKKPQKINNWMKTYMFDFYNNECFKRKSH